jgi:hypothetical protein
MRHLHRTAIAQAKLLSHAIGHGVGIVECNDDALTIGALTARRLGTAIILRVLVNRDGVHGCAT